MSLRDSVTYRRVYTTPRKVITNSHTPQHIAYDTGNEYAAEVWRKLGYDPRTVLGHSPNRDTLLHASETYTLIPRRWWRHKKKFTAKLGRARRKSP